MLVSVVSAANSNNYMLGTVSSYSNQTLTLNILTTNGSGTFNSWLINLAGSAGPVGATGAAGSNGAAGAPGGIVISSATGLKIVNNPGTPSTKINITAVSAAMANAAGTSVVQKGASVTIDLTTGTSTSTANGMDGEARGTSAWVYLYLINNGTTTAGLATLTSPLSAGPTLPAGYTYSLYVGAMRVDGSGNLMQTIQYGKDAQYVVTAATNTAALPQLASGAAGSVSVPTWVSVAMGAFVPPTASVARIVAESNGAAATPSPVIVAPNNSYGVAASANSPPFSVTATATENQFGNITLESTNIYWASTNNGGAIGCVGWTDYCVAA